MITDAPAGDPGRTSDVALSGSAAPNTTPSERIRRADMNDRVASTLRELEAYMNSKEDALNIPRMAGEFVYAMLRASGARHGVEIGTSYGYSALWAAAALVENGGELITIDRQPHKLQAAAGFFARAGLDQVIHRRLGSAEEVLPGIIGPIDYVLNDADKPNCRAYVEALIDRLSPRAIVLTDNTDSHQAELAPFCAWVRSRGDFASAQVPVGNGMEMSVFLGRGAPAQSTPDQAPGSLA